MIGLRVFWALFLAGIVGLCFRRSWRWEHGKDGADELFYSEECGRMTTAVWLSPLLLPLMMTAGFLLYLLLGDGQRFFGVATQVLLTVIVYFALLAALLPLLRRCISARACAVLWLLPVFEFYQFNVLAEGQPRPLLTVYLPGSALRAAVAVWAAGFAAVLLWYTVSHLAFRRRVLRQTSPVNDPQTLAIWQAELDRVDYRQPGRLLQSAAASAPFSTGLFKRTRLTVLPERFYSADDLMWIFRHEIRHLQRGDVETKLFLTFCNALCWFCPLVWLATRRAAEDIELSCDEWVLKEADEPARRRYAELLLRSAGPQRGFTTCLSASARSLRYRLRSIMSAGRRLTGTAVLMAAMFLCVMSYGLAAVTTERTTADRLLDGASVGTVYYQMGLPLGTAYAEDKFSDSALREALSGLTAEQLLGQYQNRDEAARQLSLYFSDTGGRGMMNIYDDSIVVEYYRADEKGHSARRQLRCWLLRDQVDWARVEQCFSAHAD